MTTLGSANDDSEPPGGPFGTITCMDPVGEAQAFPMFGDMPSVATSSPVLDPQLTYLTSPAPPQAPVRQRMSARSLAFRRRFYPSASRADWCDWHWQIDNAVRELDTLRTMLRLSAAEFTALSGHATSLPMAITPYYASLLEPDDPQHGLRRTVVPVPQELTLAEGEADDPLGEDSQSPVPGLVHRYPDRVLFLVTGMCSTYCRFCTRSRLVGHGSDEVCFGPAQWEAALQYIARTPSVRDVLLSGGDPLTLNDDDLEWLLWRLRAIAHVEVVRIGTKIPAVLPQRVTPKLVRMLKRYHPLWMSCHFTHPDELTAEAALACSRLADAGIPLGSQTVLMAGINDDVETMRRLVQGLMKMRVRPYYMYQCDPIRGSAHFRTPVERGLEIIRGLRGFTSGYAVPSYVIDAPGGGGKIPLLPEYLVGRENGAVVLRNFEDKLFRYPDRAGHTPAD